MGSVKRAFKSFCSEFWGMRLQDKGSIVSNIATVIASLILVPTSIWITVIFSQQQKEIQESQQEIIRVQWVTSRLQEQKENAKRAGWDAFGLLHAGNSVNRPCPCRDPIGYADTPNVGR